MSSTFVVVLVILCVCPVICQEIYTKSESCPCEKAEWCKPITNTTRKEVFIFSAGGKNSSIWSQYDWSRVTTVVTFGYVSQQMMCLAHRNGARVVIMANMAAKYLTNSTKRAQFVKQKLAIVTKNFLDGVNIDFEDAIPKDEPELNAGYTSLIKETSSAFKNANPAYQVTVDVAWSPDCIDGRCYNYTAIAAMSDFVFVMSYDEQSQIKGDCIAKANSGYFKTQQGLRQYMDLGISADKLVLGLPWYGYMYQCLSLSKDVCSIRHVPFRGVNCSDAAGRQIPYNVVLDYLTKSKSHRVWNHQTLTPYFTLQLNNTTYQVQYDDPTSLNIKTGMAMLYNLRGVGIWNADLLDYSKQTPQDIKIRQDMWNTLPLYKKENLN